MPYITHEAAFKAAAGYFSLLLSAHHNLRFPTLQYDETPNDIHAEVSAQNPLLFTLSGSKDGILATHDELLTSKTTNHLLQLLRKVLISSDYCQSSYLSARTHLNLAWSLYLK